MTTGRNPDLGHARTFARLVLAVGVLGSLAANVAASEPTAVGRAVAAAASPGATRQQLADELGVSPRTVSRHLNGSAPTTSTR